MKSSLGPFFDRLAYLLPAMLEEDDVTQGVLSSDLMTSLMDLASPWQAETALAVVERLFCAMALIHAESVAQGLWRFNSYSAWLVARSLLETLATDHHTVLDPGYWSNQPAEIELEEQRALLTRLENDRVAYHPTNTARPIRFVYVAWAVIRLNDRFLLYAREDKVRTDARGHFGLPGGRFKLSDAPLTERPPTAEHDFAYGTGHWPMAHLQRSLYRELREELELSERDHYSLGAPIDIAPYSRIEGARNHHSYTEYRMRLFPLQLNSHGALKLFERLQCCPELFAWFTAKELSIERNSRGQRAFVTALVEHFGLELKELVALPQAIKETYLLNTQKIGIDIPLLPGQPITSGRSGKPPKEHLPRLTAPEHRWLWALAWHAKALPFTGAENVDLLPSGWVRVDDIAKVLSLRDKLEASGLPLVEIEKDKYARLSINPRMVYFHNDFFRYRLHGDSIRGSLELLSGEVNSPLGVLRHEPVFFELNTSLTGELRHLDGIESLAENTRSPEGLRRMLDAAVSEATKDMGIRQLIANVDKDREYRKLLIKKYKIASNL